MNYETAITLDMSGEQYTPPVIAKQGDKDSRYIVATLTVQGQPYTIPTGTTARISVIKPHGECVLNDAQIEKENVKILLTEQMLIDSGIARAEVMLFQGDAVLSSAVFDLIIQEAAYDQKSIESAPEYNTFVDALAKMQGLTEESQQATKEATTQAAYAEEQGDYAKAQGDNAKTQAGNASAQAQTASLAASQAESASQAANKAATSATTAAQRANDAAQQVEGLDVTQLDTRLSQHVSSKAAASAWGHTRLAGNGGSTSYTMPMSTSAGSISTLDSTAYLYAGVYMISINSSTAGTNGLQGLTSTATRATLITLPPNNITGSPSSGNALEQILSIPKLRKTYHRYCRVSSTEYGAWAPLLDGSDLGKAGGAAALDASGMVLAGGSPIIESGSNGNGEWIKWADGTQVCAMIKNITVDITDKWGYLYSSAEIDLGEYPLAFNASYPVVRQMSMAKGEKAHALAAMWYLGDTIFPSNTTPGGIHLYRTSGEAGVNVNVHILAIGRWK